MRTAMTRVAVFFVAAVLIVCGCAPVVTPTQAPEAGVTPAAAPAEATPAEAAAATLEEYFNAPRNETLILDNPGRLEGADNWNPFVPGNATGWGYNRWGQTPLLLVNYGTGEIENWAAESFTSNEDFTVWTLVLRKGITWNDGVPFTADDVVFSVQLQMDVEPLGAHYTYKEWVDRVEKVDDFTVLFHLKKANPRFAMERFAAPTCGYDMIVPKHIWEGVEDPLTFKNFDLEAGLPLGTGPYILYRVTANDTIWVRNDDWWGAKVGLAALPAPKKIVLTYLGTEEVRVATAIDNGLDGLEDITLSSFEALLAGNANWRAFHAELPYTWPDPCARSLSLNSAVEPWNDKDMRWMLSYVMDRQEIVDIAYEGTTIMGLYPWPEYPAMQKYSDLVPQETLARLMEPNLAEAERILKEKGYTKTGDYWEKDGKVLSLEIQVHEAYSELERIADVYVEQLQRFGIDGVKVKLTGQTWGDNFNLGQYEAQSGWQTCGSIMEPYLSLNTMAGEAAPIGERPISGQTNPYRWYNERYTELVREIGTLGFDDPRVLELTSEALAIYYDEMPVPITAQAKKLIPHNYTYWVNWPTDENYYQRPTIWCAYSWDLILNIKPAE